MRAIARGPALSQVEFTRQYELKLNWRDRSSAHAYARMGMYTQTLCFFYYFIFFFMVRVAKLHIALDFPSGNTKAAERPVLRDQPVCCTGQNRFISGLISFFHYILIPAARGRRLFGVNASFPPWAQSWRDDKYFFFFFVPRVTTRLKPLGQNIRV